MSDYINTAERGEKAMIKDSGDRRGVLTVDGSVKIGAYRFSDRKKPCLCVEKGTPVRCTALLSTPTVQRNS